MPQKYQFRVLFWGIFGALVLRAIFIFAGVALIETVRLDPLRVRRVPAHHRRARRPAQGRRGPPREQPGAASSCARSCPSTNEYDGQKLFTRRTGRLLATPLFAVLILVETTDVVFAVDSIPAILAVSREPFIVFSSNAFAILGLRALYFLLAGMAGRVPLPQHRPRRDPRLRRHQDAHRRVVPLPDLASAWSSSRCVLTVTIWLSLRAEKRDLAAEVHPGGHAE